MHEEGLTQLDLLPGVAALAGGGGLAGGRTSKRADQFGAADSGGVFLIYQLIGSGQAVVFTDGGATTASWSKAADGAPTYLLDSAGKPVSLSRGSTWYEIVPTGAAVSY